MGAFSVLEQATAYVTLLFPFLAFNIAQYRYYNYYYYKTTTLLLLSK